MSEQNNAYPLRTLQEVLDLTEKLKRSRTGLVIDGFFCSIVDKAVRVYWMKANEKGKNVVLPCYENMTFDSFTHNWLRNFTCDTQFLTKPELARTA